MLTPSMITAGSATTLTDEEVLNLLLLVKHSSYYTMAQGLFTDLSDKLAEEKANPTVITKALHAVLTQLDTLPAEVVESQGRTTSPTFFATKENWNDLALDVLMLFYDNPAMLGLQSWAVAQRPVENLVLKDNVFETMKQSKTGRRY